MSRAAARIAALALIPTACRAGTVSLERSPAPARSQAIAADPRAQERLERFRAVLRESGAAAGLLVRDGRVLVEEYAPGCPDRMSAMSCTKAITGLLIGILVDEGAIRSVDDPVSRYVPQWTGGIRGRVTIRHLMTHTSGLASWRAGVGSTRDKRRFVLSLMPEREPETNFEYSNEGVQLLELVMLAASRTPVDELARRRLFAPLGMGKTSLKRDAAGCVWTYADMTTTPRDLLKIGQLILAIGRWKGRRIVSERWLDLALRRASPVAPHQGLLWSIVVPGTCIAAFGYLENMLLIYPESNAVVVRMQQEQGPVDAAEHRPRLLSAVDRVLAP